MSAEARAQVPSVGIQVITHLWMWWIRIALEHEAGAAACRSELERIAESGSAEWGDLFSRESSDGLIAVSASAHTIDALYGKIKSLAPVPADLVETWVANDTKRPARILETLKFAFDIVPHTKRWSVELRWLFDLRDAAVHFEEAPKPPAEHPVVGLMAPENIVYGLEAASRAVDLALQMLDVCTRSPRPATEKWAADFGPVVEQVSAWRVLA